MRSAAVSRPLRRGRPRCRHSWCWSRAARLRARQSARRRIFGERRSGPDGSTRSRSEIRRGFRRAHRRAGEALHPEGSRESCGRLLDRLPGPLIRAKPGDRLKVHFENRLPMETTLHFHGIRVPNAMDGVPDVTNRPCPRAEASTRVRAHRRRALLVPPPLRHRRAGRQRPLRGHLVDDPDEPGEIGDETVLVISDISLDEEEQDRARIRRSVHDCRGKRGQRRARQRSRPPHARNRGGPASTLPRSQRRARTLRAAGCSRSNVSSNRE